MEKQSTSKVPEMDRRGSLEEREAFQLSIKRETAENRKTAEELFGRAIEIHKKYSELVASNSYFEECDALIRELRNLTEERFLEEVGVDTYKSILRENIREGYQYE